MLPSVLYYFFTDEKYRAIIENASGADADEFLSEEDQVALEYARSLRSKSIKLGLDLNGGLSIEVEADFDKYAELVGGTASDISEEEKEESIDRIITKVRNRIDSAGVSEISIRKQPNYRLSIEIPGESSPERIENLVATTGRLEFRLVAVTQPASVGLVYDLEKGTIEKSSVPSDLDAAFVYDTNEAGERGRSYVLLLEKEVYVDGNQINNARLGYGQYGEPVVTFELNAAGTRAFAKVTGENIGRQLAVVLDGNIMVVPSISTVIADGQAEINGRFGLDEARDLSLILRSGSLPVPIRIISQDIIDARVGKDLRARAFKALLLGLGSVMLFIILFYRLSGVIAIVSLLINAFLVVAFLASFGLSVSLAGIAGLILTIGMSIDANVIIFARIREELELDDYNLVGSVRRGYQRAFWAIFDSNITTLIAAFVLFNFGSGFLQGFATTLFVGIIVSMFTSLFITRFVFDFLLDYKILKRYSKIII